MSFLQEPPSLEGLNVYHEDQALRDWVERNISSPMKNEIVADFNRFGARVTEELETLNRNASLERNKPYLVQINGWGERVDDIITCPEWKQLHRVAAEEGVIAYGYGKGSRQRDALSRVHQFVKLYLFIPVAALVSCPLAMTDGACRLIEQMNTHHPLILEAFERLTTTNPDQFWTSGQWMTERTGGSDVSNTETTAVRDIKNYPNDDDRYLLNGYKFFTSATTSQCAFTLARTGGEGSKGLSLFFVKLRDEKGKLNGIRVERLKDKLGTKQVPTAELSLHDVPAVRLGKEGHGVRNIALLFNVTRLHSSVSGVSSMRRILFLARDYAQKRKAFGRNLLSHPSHLETMGKMEITFRANLHLNFETVRIFGLSEAGGLGDQEAKKYDALLRILTPLCKLYTSKEANAVISEGLECFGGAGYMEDTGLPVILRDHLVNSIWEGTTNVLSHDVLRALSRSPLSFSSFQNEIQRRLEQGKQYLAKSGKNQKRIRRAVEQLVRDWERIEKTKKEIESNGGYNGAFALAISRSFAFSLAHSFASACLIDHACWSDAELDAFVAEYYCCEHHKRPHDVMSSPLTVESKMFWTLVTNSPLPPRM